MAKKFLTPIDFSSLAGKNFVLPYATADTVATVIPNPVGGQKYYDTAKGIEYVYNAVKTRWECGSAGALTVKGVVGLTEQPALPDKPNVGDAWYVGKDGTYTTGATTTKAVIGDLLFCTSEASTDGATPAVWDLLPSGNGRYEGDITGDGTKTDFEFENTLGTDKVIYAVYDATTSEEVIVDVTKSDTDFTVKFAAAPKTGENYKLLVIAG